MSMKTQGRKNPAEHNIIDICDSISLALDGIKRKSNGSPPPDEVAPVVKRRIVETPIQTMNNNRCLSALNSSGSDDSVKDNHILIQRLRANDSNSDPVPGICNVDVIKPTKEIIVPIIHTCSICHSTFPQQNFLNRHVALVHSKNDGNNSPVDPENATSNKRQIPKASKAYEPQNEEESRRTTRSHNQQHGNSSQIEKFQGMFHQCHHCFQKFKDRHSLGYHILKIHHNIRPGWYHCRDCNSQFHSIGSHKKHIEGHTTTIQKLLETSNVPNLKSKECKEFEKSKRVDSSREIDASPKLPLNLNKCCPLCPEKFEIQSELSSHVNKEHDNLKHLVYVCDICGVIFLGTPLLLEHLRRLHEKDSYCTSCSRSFVTRNDLLSHYREIGFCQACNGSFKNICQANQHVKLHLTWA